MRAAAIALLMLLSTPHVTAAEMPCPPVQRPVGEAGDVNPNLADVTPGLNRVSRVPAGVPAQECAAAGMVAVAEPAPVQQPAVTDETSPQAAEATPANTATSDTGSSTGSGG